MTKIVSLNGSPISQVTPSERAKDAREALRALLIRLDAGEVEAESWLFIYEKLHPAREDVVTTAYLDSDLTMARSVMLVENFKFDLLTAARE